MLKYIIIFGVLSLFGTQNIFSQVKDIDGNLYDTLKIGDNVWMTRNLDVSRFGNGDTINEVRSKLEWHEALNQKVPAWCYFNNDSNNSRTCGKFYNIYAIMDIRKIAPEGYHLPDDLDWENLLQALQPEITNVRKILYKKNLEGISAEEMEDSLKKLLENPNFKAAYKLRTDDNWSEENKIKYNSSYSGFNCRPCKPRDEHGIFKGSFYDPGIENSAFFFIKKLFHDADYLFIAHDIDIHDTTIDGSYLRCIKNNDVNKKDSYLLYNLDRKGF